MHHITLANNMPENHLKNGDIYMGDKTMKVDIYDVGKAV